MTPFDLTLLLLLSNAVQNAMTGPDTSVLGGIVAAATLLLLNYLVAEVAGGNRRFRKFVQGQPSLLVHDGKIIAAHMAREHVTMDALQQALREHGIATYHDVALAVLEVDGSISCMKYDDIKPTASTHLARRKILKKHRIAFRGLFELQQHDLRLGSDPQRRPPRACSVGCVHQKISQALQSVDKLAVQAGSNPGEWKELSTVSVTGKLQRKTFFFCDASPGRARE